MDRRQERRCNRDRHREGGVIGHSEQPGALRRPFNVAVRMIEIVESGVDITEIVSTATRALILESAIRGELSTQRGVEVRGSFQEIEAELASLRQLGSAKGVLFP